MHKAWSSIGEVPYCYTHSKQCCWGVYWFHFVCLSVRPAFCVHSVTRGGTRSKKWWGCAPGRWKLDPKRSREKWNLGPKRSNSVRIGSFNTPKDRFGVGGWEKIPQKDRARSCQSEKRGSKPRHICITHHIGSTPPGSVTPTVLDGYFHIRHKWSLAWEFVSHQITFDLDLYLQGHSAMILQ